jgi:hypothetical protein
MKKFLFLLIIVLCGKTYSQDLSGKWHVISYEDEIVYFNKATDSLYYKDSARKVEAENFKEMSDFLIFPITYKFDDNKITMNYPMMDEISGDFVNDELKKKITFTDKNGKTGEFPYTYINEILFFEIEMENGFIKIGLMKN